MDRALAEKTAAEHGLKVADTFDAVLADPDIDAVILVTPHSLHTDQIVAGAAAGKHVFTEKPFALSKSEAERAVTAAEAAGIQLGLGHNQRFNPPVVEMKRMVDSGEIGTVMHFEGNLSHDELINPGSWRYDPVEAPGNGLWHMGSHFLDLYGWILGPVKEVYAQAVDRVLERDSAQALLQFESGPTGYIGNSTYTARLRSLSLYGSNGWARMKTLTEMEVCMRGETEPKTISFEPTDIVRANMEGFADAIAGVAPYRFTYEEMIHDVEALDAMAKSLREHRPVRVGE
ncbi:MAG: Gfo/Idh/MocA family oxidoreductase [Alphaproteobacteria bacterium]